MQLQIQFLSDKAHGIQLSFHLAIFVHHCPVSVIPKKLEYYYITSGINTVTVQANCWHQSLSIKL